MAVAILAGLIHRNRTGEGQWIDMACTEAGTTLVGPDLLDYTVNGRPLRRAGQPDSNRSHSPARAPHGIYPAAGDDNWIAIACRDDADWRPLAGVIDEPWATDARNDTLAERLAVQDALDERLGAWTATRDRFATAEALRGGRRARGGGRTARGSRSTTTRRRASGGCGRPCTTARWATSASTAPGAPVGDRLGDRARRPVPRRAHTARCSRRSSVSTTTEIEQLAEAGRR